ncbi:SDR family oxidoreductase [Daeguia caeni]|uniref:SDR family oxidoreductase n=1 Tax=Daeguia caeni TaxID=439612 RepID=A0ABV9H5K9_9HYPH
MRIFFFGAGYSARAFARLIKDEAKQLDGTTRKVEDFPILEQAHIAPLLFDGVSAAPELPDRLARASHVIISVPPRETKDPCLALVAEALSRPDNQIRWIGYLSTVGVYGDYQGRWIDETAECITVSPRSLERLAAERAWMALANQYGLPLAILRLSGIYGPGRNAFINLERGTARRIIKPGQIFNRIHVDDIAGVLRFLSSTDKGGIFNVTDSEPAPAQDVVSFAAELMGVTPPPEIPFEQAEMTPMARSFYDENKRVSNKRLINLGYEFVYPDYRAAFLSMWRDKNW